MKWNKIKAHQIKSNQIISNQFNSNHIKSIQIISNQFKSNQIKSYHINSNHINSIQINSNRIKSYQIKSCNWAEEKWNSYYHVMMIDVRTWLWPFLTWSMADRPFTSNRKTSAPFATNLDTIRLFFWIAATINAVKPSDFLWWLILAPYLYT